MTVVVLPAAAQLVTLVRELCGGTGPIDALARAAVERRAEMGTRRSERDAALDVVSCWLLDRIRARGADEVFARTQLVRIWAPKVIRWTRATAGTGVDTDDVAQEVSCRFAANLGELRDGLAIGAWLWRTTYLVLRESERRSWLGRWLDDTGWFETAEDPGEAPLEALVRSEQLALVQGILASLPLEQRSLLWAAYVEKMDRARMSDVFALAPGTLGRKLTGARRAFERACRARGQLGELQ